MRTGFPVVDANVSMKFTADATIVCLNCSADVLVSTTFKFKFPKVMEGESAAAVAQAEADGKTAALVPFGLGETQTADAAGSSRLARADQEKNKPRGAVRLNVEDLKVLTADEAPVSPESLLQAEELERM